MTDNTELYQQLAQEFYRPSAMESVLQAFHSIDPFLATGKLNRVEAFRLKTYAFRSMREAATGDPVRSRELILDLLLPHCLSRSRDGEDEDGFARSQYRESLRDWLDDLHEPSRSEIRDEVLKVLSAELERPDPEPACWTIAVVGYRGPGVSEALWKVVEANAGETGDVALDTLTELGLPPDKRDKILKAACGRAHDRCNTALVGTMWRLADPDSLDTIERCWLSRNEEAFWPRLSHLILRAMAEILIVNPGHPDLHDRVWSLIAGLFGKDPSRFEPALRLDINLAPSCDSPHVIPFMLSRLLYMPEDSEQSGIQQHIIHSRLQECTRPRQLEGWLGPLDPGIRELIWRDATQDTGAPSRFVSPAVDLKESSCEALLCLADSSLASADAFEELVGKESSTYARKLISDLLACMRFDPLPATAVRWVTERVDVDRQDTGDELIFRSAADRVLRSAASHEAFVALSSFGHTMNGAILRQTMDALTDVAVNLAVKGDSSAVDMIVNIVRSGSERHHRAASAEAMMHMAALGLLSSHHGSGLPEALGDTGRDEFERSRIVATLGYLPGDLLTPGVERQLVEWSQGRDMLAWKSLETLARHDRLAAYDDLLIGRLGLHPAGEGWGLEAGSKEAGGSGYILGLLFSRQPGKFLEAVLTFIRVRDWVDSAQLVHALDFFYHGPSPHPVHPGVIHALIERTRLRQTRSAADLELFRFLGKWDAGSLARQPWGQDWDAWMPDARVALADALGDHCPYEGDAQGRAIDLLLSLTSDGIYAVRRSACRALSRLSGESLEAYSTASSDSPSWDLRRRAAEACGWLPADDTYEALYRRFATDPEGPVRTAAKRARLERRDRSDGERYLKFVLGCTEGDNEEMLRAWRFGRALQVVGDDSCIERILNHVQEQPLPGNVRHWLSLIREGIQKRWREVTQKWPEPWLTWNGTIEEGLGTIRAGDAGIGVRYSVWKQPAMTPSDYSRWGGAAWSSEAFNVFNFALGEADLILSTGERGSILINSTQSTGQLRFSGQGPYPK